MGQAKDHEVTRDRFRYFFKICVRVIGICAAIGVILAEDGVGPAYLSSIGKALFWTGLVFVPLIGFNLDVLESALGKLSAIVLCALQALLVVYFFEYLKGMNFILLTPVCLIQCLIFSVPFMLIRKRNIGVWY